MTAAALAGVEQALRLRLALRRAGGFALDVDLALPLHGTTVLFGPSGSGKTTLLRAAAGLEPQARGCVALGQEVWQDDAAGVRLPTWQRALGYVFQEASLFDHLDVRGNVGYGLRRRGARADAEGTRARDEAVALLGIGALMDRAVADLSGGERQRVAIARALAVRPRLLLMDEPLAALDPARRQGVAPWLQRLCRTLRIPMLYVTHTVAEVVRLADHLVVLDAGRVRAAGPVADVLCAIDPPLPLGDDAGALVHAHVAERDEAWSLVRAAFDGGSLWLRDGGQAVGDAVRLRVLARDVSVQLQPPPPGLTSVQNHLPAVVEAIVDDGDAAQRLLRLRCGPTPLLARLTRRAVAALALTPGCAVWVQVKSVAVGG